MKTEKNNGPSSQQKKSSPITNRFGTKKAVAIMVWFTNSQDQKFLMLTKRLTVPKFSGWYAAVGGSVEKGECVIRAAQREMIEETEVYVGRDELKLIDCYTEDDFKCFIFEVYMGTYRFNEIKNAEPEKHSPWKLYTSEEALKLPNLMPAVAEILLTNQQTSV